MKRGIMKMKKIILILLPAVSVASQLPPTPFPVFLKSGFSSVLEFDEVPVRVVLGDGQSFQVEKVDHSLVVRTLTPYAASNMFVYFKDSQPRLFILTASEDANPTYYKKFDKEIVRQNALKPADSSFENLGVKAEPKIGYVVRVLYASFDTKKDYLTLECELQSKSHEVLKPAWNLVRISFQSKALSPFKLWSERQEVQKDTKVKFRLIFAKPNLPRDLKGVSLIVPLLGQPSAISVPIRLEVSK
jgi:hypothetical protein